jgi:hypothetical protein
MTERKASATATTKPKAKEGEAMAVEHKMVGL